jgi:SAM-dependent methyltransferase
MTKKLGWVEIDRCPVCKSRKRHLFGQFHYEYDNIHEVEEFLDVDEDGGIHLTAYLCECGYGYTHRRIEDLDRYYAEVYYPLLKGRMETEEDPERIHTDELMRAERQAKQFADGTGLTSLDVGCGSGKLMELMKAMGWTTYGLDPRIQDLNTYHSVDDLLAHEPGKKFDLITMSHVLEHVPNPVEWLAEFKPLLAEGGQIFIEVPSIVWNANGLFSLHHCGAYTMFALQDVAEKAGFMFVDGGPAFVSAEVNGEIGVKIVLQAIIASGG